MRNAKQIVAEFEPLKSNPTANRDRLIKLDKEARGAFKALSAENSALLAKDEMLASESRAFDVNIDALAELKSILDWVDEPDAKARAFMPEVPFRDEVKGVADLDGCVVGGAKGLVVNRREVDDLFMAAKNRGSKVINAITAITAPMGDVYDPDSGLFDWARDKLRLLDFLPVGYTNYPKTGYYRATAAASAAGAVAAGGIKPESSPTWEFVDSPIVKVAHWGKVHDEVVADFDAFVNTVGGEFLNGLIDAETDQLLNGTGVGAQMTGMLNTPGIGVQTFSVDIITTLAKAVTKLRTGPAKAEPDLFVLSAVDWEDITLYRTGGSTAADGPFLLNPITAAPLTLWGVPVVVTTRIAAGTAMVANVAIATRARMRQAPRLDVAPGTSEAEWKTNITLIRAEERIGLEVPRPAAIVSAAVSA